MLIHDDCGGTPLISCEITKFNQELVDKLISSKDSDQLKVNVCKSVSGKEVVVMHKLKTIGVVDDEDFINHTLHNKLNVKQFTLMLESTETNWQESLMLFAHLKK